MLCLQRSEAAFIPSFFTLRESCLMGVGRNEDPQLLLVVYNGAALWEAMYNFSEFGLHSPDDHVIPEWEEGSPENLGDTRVIEAFLRAPPDRKYSNTLHWWVNIQWSLALPWNIVKHEAIHALIRPWVSLLLLLIQIPDIIILLEAKVYLNSGFRDFLVFLNSLGPKCGNLWFSEFLLEEAALLGATGKLWVTTSGWSKIRQWSWTTELSL